MSYETNFPGGQLAIEHDPTVHSGDLNSSLDLHIALQNPDGQIGQLTVEFLDPDNPNSSLAEILECFELEPDQNSIVIDMMNLGSLRGPDRELPIGTFFIVGRSADGDLLELDPTRVDLSTEFLYGDGEEYREEGYTYYKNGEEY